MRRNQRLEQFRKNVQANIVGEPESWYGPLISRHISFRLAWVIVNRTSFSANAVTFIMMLIGLIGVVCFALPPQWWIVGAICLHAHLVLDATDGEVARGRGRSSPSGVYIDAVGHYFVNPGIFWALGFANLMLPLPGRLVSATLALLAVVWAKAAEQTPAEIAYRIAQRSQHRRYGDAAGGIGGPQVVLSDDVARHGIVRIVKMFGLTDAATAISVLTVSALLMQLRTLWAPAADYASYIDAVGAVGLGGVIVAKGAYLFYRNYRTMAS